MTNSPWAAGERFEQMELGMMRLMVETIDQRVRSGMLSEPVTPHSAVQVLMPIYGKDGCLMFLHYLEKAMVNADIAAELTAMVAP
jgi:hypothetical protein